LERTGGMRFGFKKKNRARALGFHLPGKSVEPLTCPKCESNDIWQAELIFACDVCGFERDISKLPVPRLQHSVFVQPGCLKTYNEKRVRWSRWRKQNHDRDR